MVVHWEEMCELRQVGLSVLWAVCFEPTEAGMEFLFLAQAGLPVQPLHEREQNI